MQLKALAAGASLAIVLVAGQGSARAQAVTFDTAHTIYLEAPAYSHMTVYTPGGSLQVQPFDWLQVRAGWEADVVSGASVTTKSGPAYTGTHPGVDVVSAASVHDLRNSVNGGFTLKKDAVSLTGGYAYSTEHDYRSNSFNVAARTELFEHNTQLEIAYARNFDSVCDRVQVAGAAPTQYVALENSSGCFAANQPARTTDPIAIDGFQGSWSQAWTPIFTTQLVYTAQIVNGFQADPYRSVLLADGVKAQEHEPENRAREAIALRGNIFFKPIKAALRLGVRAYWDTWDVKAVSGEAEFEKYIFDPFRLMVRARVYTQSGAIFYSDDYTGGNPPLGPKGQYWTGDKELSPFTSFLVGLRAIYSVSPSKRILGIMSGLRVGLSADMLQFDYTNFTYGGNPLTKSEAYVGTLDLMALF